MGYCADDSVVRVEFFRLRGGGYKWYTTEAVQWITWRADDADIFTAFHEALDRHLKGRLMSGLQAICLEPYHEHAHPIAVIVR